MSKQPGPRWRRAGWWEDPPGDLEDPYHPLPGDGPEPAGLTAEERDRRNRWVAAQARRSPPSPGRGRDPVNEVINRLDERRT
ncbi:hypothetical protein P3102_10675 [Amycolatopsis sp. QT-25]|uniref:hypothetical protein n=1 Tax=Amycolatopsis sp. QT-25 TaxID=3034022 RepID=UPI0023EE0601|nr:hypothetical protein [Amycolatopsis sp. QT-25]WET81635.1 hypothetical protein P3102_10675 [Amycolatopsis sp. QT-25]